MTTPITRLTVAAATALLSLLAFVLLGNVVGASEPAVDLGNAKSYAVLAGTTVTSTGLTTVSGDLGVSPGSAVTGFPPGIVTNGTIHAADAGAASAQADLTTAYNSAAGRATNVTVSADLAGQKLVGGVYTGGALALNGTVTLDAQNVADTVWIFQAASTLITGSDNSTVAFVNGANPCNVFWQVGSSATLGSGTTFVGSILALTSITAVSGATIQGRLLARNGAVTLDDNVIDSSNCTPAPTTTTTAADSTSTTAAPTTTAAGPTTTTATGPTSTTAAPTTTTAAPTTTTAAPTTTTTGLGATTTVLAPTTTVAGVTTTTAAPTTTIAPTTTVAAAATTVPVGATTTTIRPTVTTVAGATTTTALQGATATTAAPTTTTRAQGTTTTTAASTATTASRATTTTAVPAMGGALTTTTTTPTLHPELPRTGAPLAATAAAGLLILVLGGILVRRSRDAAAADRPQS